MTTHTCPRALGRAEPCTCGGATCGGERDPLAEARGLVDVAGQHAMLSEMEPGGEVMGGVLRSLAALAAAGLALREAMARCCGAWESVDDLCDAVDAFDAALAAALGPRQEGNRPMDADALTPAEAVYGFAAWLTTRTEQTVMSAADDSASVAALAARFCEANGLGTVTEQWPGALVMPDEPTDEGRQIEAPTSASGKGEA